MLLTESLTDVLKVITIMISKKNRTKNELGKLKLWTQYSDKNSYLFLLVTFPFDLMKGIWKTI